MCEAIDHVLKQFFAQYPLTKIKSLLKDKRKVVIGYKIEERNDPTYTGSIQNVSYQKYDDEWNGITITLLYTFGQYPDINNAMSFLDERRDEILSKNFLSRCEMEVIKGIAKEIDADDVMCLYNRSAKSIDFILRQNIRVIFEIRFREGYPLVESDHAFFSFKEMPK